MAEKKTVSAREVVADIRTGMTDEQLMLKHGLSAKGLESLKNKLVTAGLLTPLELDGKSPSTQVADPSVDKRAFAKNIADAVKNGLPDAEIIKRFGISAAKLPRVYESLVKAGYLSQEDLNRRSNGEGFEQTVDLASDVGDTVPNPSQAAPVAPTETTKDVLRDFAQRFNIPREELERLKTASIKDVKAFFEKHNIPWSEGIELAKALGLRAGDFALEAAGKLKNKAKGLISRIESNTGEAQTEQVPEEPETEKKKISWSDDGKVRAIILFAGIATGMCFAQWVTKSWFWFIVWMTVFTGAAAFGYFLFWDNYKNKIKYVAIAGIIFAVMVVGNWGKSQSATSSAENTTKESAISSNKSTSSPGLDSQQAASIVKTPMELWVEFDRNEAMALDNYKGKQIRVKWDLPPQVTEKDGSTILYQSDNYDRTLVATILNKGYRGKLSGIKFVDCLCVGKRKGVIVLQDCKVVE